QAALWERRNQLREIAVWAHEPFIPWELLYLAPPPRPDGIPVPAPADSRFLGELGLVRWLHSHPQWATTIEVRPNRAFHLVPDYPSAKHRLAAADEERDFLHTTFGAMAAPAPASD